jgi:hypothetical protein
MEEKPTKGEENMELQAVTSNEKKDKLSNKTASGVMSMKSEGISKASIATSYGTKGMEKQAESEGVEEKVADEDLPEKRSHKIGEGCSLFPIHTWLFFLYIILAIVLAVFGTLLIINGNWANTGYFSFHAIINWPWPKVEVEDQDYHAMALEFLQLTCWICGFFFWLFAIYLVYVVYVYYNLLWVAMPWDRQVRNGVRVAANQVLVQGKVRDETQGDQFNRMKKNQQQEMKKYKRNLIDPTKFA